jgi:hypothetical protein
VPADAPVAIAESVYEIRIKPGIRYQPHPAFARDEAGKLLYPISARGPGKASHSLRDFEHTGTRELTAADYVYQIKRLAHPRLHSPVFGLMSEYIVGLKELGERLKVADAAKAAGGPAMPGWICRSSRSRASRWSIVHLPHPHQGQVSAVRLLAGDALLRAGAARGRSFLRPARHGREEPDAGLVSGRHRPLHADREQSERAHGAGAQPELPRRVLSCEGEADAGAGCFRLPASVCPS